MFSTLPVGNYHRLIDVGEWVVTYAKEGYFSETVVLNLADKASTVVQDIHLLPEDATGIQQSTNLIEVSVFPNPTHNRLSLIFTEAMKEDYRVKLYRGDGALSLVKNYLMGEQRLDLILGDLENGMYMLMIENEQQGVLYSEKVMVVQ